MRTKAIIGLLATAVVPLARADLTATRTIENSVVVERGGLTVIVDDVFGSIRVTAHDRDTVELKAIETVRGDLQADLDRARAEVELRQEQEPGRVAFRVRRIGDRGGCDGRWGCWEDYVVKYDIEVRVPRDAALDLETVNDGDIVVEGVRGDFEISNVNGEVRLSGLRGSGSIATVNGKIEARFDAAPAAATSFKTVNGVIDMTFPNNLAADLKTKTMNGEVYTDFEVQPIAREAVAETSRDGRTRRFRMESAALRVANGGPTLSFETLNGDILIRKVGR
jgi:putative adhesin